MNKRTVSHDERKTGADAGLSVWKVAGLTALVVIAIVTVAILIGGRGAGNRGNDAENATAARSGDLKYELSADRILSMGEAAEKLVLLLPDEVRYLDENCVDVAANAHHLSNPTIRTAGKNLLLYDKGGNTLRIEKNTEIFDEISTKSVITCADITANGTYAYVLNADGGFQSHLYVYSYKGKKLYEWGSSSDYILGVRLSASGKFIVVYELSVHNAEPVSRVICFRFGSEEPVFSVEMNGTAVYDAKFISKDNVIVYADTGVFRLGTAGEAEEILRYSQTEMNHSVLSGSDLCAVSLNLYGNEKNATLTIFDKRFKKSYDAQPEDEIAILGSSANAVAALAGDKIYAYNAYGTLTAVAEPPEKCFDLFVLGRKVIVSTASGLFSYSVNGTVPA